MKKVLVVDNDELILQFINDVLSKEGHRVVTAEDGLSALDILKTNVPDVIFVDLVMPNIDGKVLCKMIRRMDKLKDTYIIILSATLADQKINIAELGANACIAKGPLNEMAQHILSVTDQPDLVSARCLAGQVIGIEGISPRKITGELLSVKRHFEVVLGRMSEGILEITSEGRIVYVNPSALSLIGVPEIELLSSHFIELFAGDDRRRVAELIKTIDDRPKTISEGSPVSLSGYQVTLNILPLDGDELTSIIILNDVTEHKQAEEALRESEERFRALTESTSDRIWEVDQNAIYTYASPKVKDLLGYELEEVIGKTLFDLMPADEAERVGGLFRNIVDSREPFRDLENTNLHKDGRHVVLKTSGVPFFDTDGRLCGYRGIDRDITERKQAQEALKENEEKYRSILENIEDGYFEVDIRGNFTFFNDSLCRIHGYSKDELMGMNNRQYMDEETAKKIYQTFNKVYTTGEPAKGFEWDIIRKDGTKRHIESSVSLIRDAEGQPIGFRGIVRDITERKRLEEQLLYAQKIEAIGTLAGGIAHEFNNALVGITGNIELLKMGLPEYQSIDKYIEPMKASTRRMANLSNQLLAYAQGGKYQAQTISLSDFVEETLPLIQNTIDPAIRVETDLSRDILNVNADLTQMQMVLSAVMENAAEAIDGEGKIRIVTRDAEIDDDFARANPELKPGTYACLTIEDDGKGMDEESKGKIFDPFFTTKFQGRGLGMAAVYGIVRNHGGWISVDSELGKGTMVRIYLPVVEPEEKEVEEPKTEVTTGTGTVLVIEDEEMVMDVARAMLERLGYRVLEAKTGMEAVNLAKTFDGDIDLALLDMKLPDMEGGKVYPLIMEARPNLKVIVCSGYSIDGPAEDILNAGAQDFIQKPFSMAGLSAKLEEVLTHS